MFVLLVLISTNFIAACEKEPKEIPPGVALHRGTLLIA